MKYRAKSVERKAYSVKRRAKSGSRKKLESLWLLVWT